MSNGGQPPQNSPVPAPVPSNLVLSTTPVPSSLVLTTPVTDTKTPVAPKPRLEYNVCYSHHHYSESIALNVLKMDVNRLMGDGWEPSGGINLAVDKNGCYWSQAMTRPKN